MTIDRRTLASATLAALVPIRAEADVTVADCGGMPDHRERARVRHEPTPKSQLQMRVQMQTVSFTRYDFASTALEARTLQPLDNPFGPRLSPMS
jgi:hypothetical protein